MTLLDTLPWEPTPENIIDVCSHAVHTVLRSRYHTTEDIQDATQAAAVEVWDALQRRGDKGRGYSFQVARYAVIDWLNERQGRVAECHLEPLEWRLSTAEPDEEATDLDVARLHTFGEFTSREIAYLHYRTRGYSTCEMTQALGVSPQTIYRCRDKLLPRLAHLAGQPLPVKASRPFSEEEYRQTDQWHAMGMNWTEIARRLQRHRGTVPEAYHRYKARITRSGD